MKMDEYLRRKQELQSKQKEFDDKRKELEEAKQKAKELEDAMHAEKKKELSVSKSNKFSLLGMQFRQWTLNDMILILFVVGILVVGATSFMPGENVSSDTDSGEKGFFSRLFEGFTVKSVDNTDQGVDNGEDIEGSDDDSIDSSSGSDTEDINEPEPINNANPVDYDINIRYENSPFITINVTNVDTLWYTLNIKNRESFNIKCNINHYVNDALKSDQSTITIEVGNERNINLREMASDAGEDTLSRVKLEISCSDGSDSSTENTKVEHLEFYFN
jgi:hypothetical protein